MASRVQSRHGPWGTSAANPCPASSPGAPRRNLPVRDAAHVQAGRPVAAGNSGRFEIQSELAILTSNILGSESSTTLVERNTASPRAANPVNRREPHPAGQDGQTLGKG